MKRHHKNGIKVPVTALLMRPRVSRHGQPLVEVVGSRDLVLRSRGSTTSGWRKNESDGKGKTKAVKP